MTFQLRDATPADGPALAAVYAPYVRDTVISFEEVPPDGTQMAERLAAVQPRFPWLVAEREGRVLGYAYAGEFRNRRAYRWTCECAVYVAAEAHRSGVGRALYTALFERLRAMGMRRVIAGVTLPNAGSVGLHESFGFVPVGVFHRCGYKQERWHDVGFWELSLEQGLPETPAEPRPDRS